MSDSFPLMCHEPLTDVGGRDWWVATVEVDRPSAPNQRWIEARGVDAAHAVSELRLVIEQKTGIRADAVKFRPFAGTEKRALRVEGKRAKRIGDLTMSLGRELGA